MRDSYDKPSRLNMSAFNQMHPSKTNINMNKQLKMFRVSSIEDLRQIEIAELHDIAIGTVAIMFDVKGYPVKMFVWSGKELSWQEMASVSVEGQVLTEGTISEKGIVQIAKEGEESPDKVVLSTDERLKKEWLAQKTEPDNKAALWIDTTSTPIVKWHNGDSWIIVSDAKVIDDVIESMTTTYSSKKIEELLTKMSGKDHEHKQLTDHLKTEGNIHKMKASDLKDLSTQVLSINEIEQALKTKHVHNNKAVLDNINDVDGELFYDSNPIGRGDMSKSIYDTDNDGIVDKAMLLSDGNNNFSAIDLLNIAKKTHRHINEEILKETTDVFTRELKDKLDNISIGATKYVHPDLHDAEMIKQTNDLMFSSLAEKASWADKYTTREVEELLSQKLSKSLVGVPNGLAVLDHSGTLSIDQLPMRFKETKVVETIAERDFLNKFSGLRVFVSDASSDIKVGSGSAEYVWNGIAWKLLSGLGMSAEALKFYVDEKSDELIIKAKYSNGRIKTAKIPLL